MESKTLTPDEYYASHQKAFRCAFDYLTKHFPPGLDPEWWEHAAKDLSAASILNGEGTLTNGLLIAVYDYLEEERKRRINDGKTED